MINPNFTILALIISLAGNSVYLLDTLKGKIKPNRISYSIWAFATFIVFAAQVAQGVGIQSFFTFLNGAISLTIFFASFANKNAYWKLEKFDYICGIFSLIGLLLWYLTKVGNIAIVFSLIGDGFAFLPTIIKSYNHPTTENGYTFLLGAISAAIILLTIRTWNFESYAFPLYIVLFDLLVFILVQFKINKRLRLLQQAKS